MTEDDVRKLYELEEGESVSEWIHQGCGGKLMPEPPKGGE